MSRPKKLMGETISYPNPPLCGTLLITINYKDKECKEPCESILNGGKSGGCKALQEAVGRLTSLALRKGFKDEAIDQLYGLRCYTCMQKRASIPIEERKNQPVSCPDALARALRKEDE
jgi:hypothetical protein